MNTKPSIRPTARQRQRGVTLIEAMIAFLVMGLSMLAAISLQMTLRHSTESSRQRAEAVRLAQGAMEELRAFSTIDASPGQRAYADIATGPDTRIEGPTTQTEYVVSTRVTDGAGFKTVQIAVGWTDRHDHQPRQVRLDSAIAGLTPSMSAALMMRPAGLQARRPGSSHARLPSMAHDLGNGRSVFKPNATVVWVFDNASGMVTGRCAVDAVTAAELLAPADVQDCSDNIHGFYIAGFVRFSTGDAVGSSDAAHPSSPAMGLDMVITALNGRNDRGSSVSPTYECFDDATPSSLPGRAVVYHCVVSADRLAAWSGDLSVSPVGWTLDGKTDGFKLCRYSADYDGDGKIANAEHPPLYVDVIGPLNNQNFLVIRGNNTCPSGGIVDPASGELVSSDTVQHG